MRIVFGSGVLETATCSSSVLDSLECKHEIGDEYHVPIEACQQSVDAFTHLMKLTPDAVMSAVNELDLQTAVQVLGVADYLSCTVVVNALCKRFSEATQFVTSELFASDFTTPPQRVPEFQIVNRRTVSCAADDGFVVTNHFLMPSHCTDGIVQALPHGMLASDADYSGGMYFWDTQKDEFVGHWMKDVKHGDVTAMCALSDGRLAWASYDVPIDDQVSTVHVMTPATKKCVSLGTRHAGKIACLAAISKTILASGSYNSKVVVWNVEHFDWDSTLLGHTGAVRSIVVVPDGRVASGSDDKTIRLWDVTTSTCVGVIPETIAIRAMAVLPDGRLASGHSSGHIVLWDVDTFEQTAVWRGHDCGVTCLSVAMNSRLVSGSYDFTVKCWDTVTGHCTSTMDSGTGYAAHMTVVSDGRIAVGFTNKTVKVLTMLASKQSRTAVLRSLRIGYTLSENIVQNPTNSTRDTVKPVRATRQLGGGGGMGYVALDGLSLQLPFNFNAEAFMGTLHTTSRVIIPTIRVPVVLNFTTE